MRLFTRITVVLMFLLVSKIGYGQDDLVNTFYTQFDVDEKKTSYREYTTSTNEAKQLVSALFLFYKEFISSQDIDACVFTPSCSVYAMESIKEQGLLIGTMSAFDRMSRCHSFGREYYHVHPQTNKFYDPVEPKK